MNTQKNVCFQVFLRRNVPKNLKENYFEMKLHDFNTSSTSLVGPSSTKLPPNKIQKKRSNPSSQKKVSVESMPTPMNSQQHMCNNNTTNNMPRCNSKSTVVDAHVPLQQHDLETNSVTDNTLLTAHAPNAQNFYLSLLQQPSSVTNKVNSQEKQELSCGTMLSLDVDTILQELELEMKVNSAQLPSVNQPSPSYDSTVPFADFAWNIEECASFNGLFF